MGITLTESLTAPPIEERRFSTLDDAIEHYIGEVTWRQLLQITIVSLAWFFDAQQSFISIFTDARPKWVCANPADQSPCNSGATCTLPPDFFAQSSTITSWSLQCSDRIIAALPSTSFFAGSIAGGLLLSPISDSSLGRKRMLLICCLFMSVAGAASAASVNIWMYSSLRFISGMGRHMIGSCVLVHSAELVGKKWRPRVGTFGYVSFALGFLSLPLIAFLLRENSWRFVYLSTCGPCILYCLILQLLVDESPRWLFIKSRKKEFAEALQRISSPERRVSAADLTQSINWDAVDQQSEENLSFYSSVKILLQEKSVRKRLLLICAACITIGLAYFGFPFSLGSLSLNPYIAVVINALMEFPASLITFLAVGNLDRRLSIFAFAAVSGVCGVATAVVRNQVLQLWLEITAFTTAVTVLDLILVYALELFPTCVRNSGMTAARLAVNLGGAVFQVVMAMGDGNPTVSFGVTGVAIATSGLLVYWLPETRGRRWTDLINESQPYQSLPMDSTSTNL